MANELTTAGVTVGYAFEAESGTRPTSGYQKLPGIKSTPDLNPEPSNLEVTDLSDKEWKRYIAGMKDPGGALGFNCNNTDEFQAAWWTLCYLSEIAREDDLATWFVVDIPGLTKAFFFAAIPSKLGVIGMEVDAVAEVTAFVSPNDVEGWETAPTNPAVYITPIQTQYIDSDDDPLEITPTLEAEASVDTVESSNDDVVTVTDDGTDITITYVGAGEAYITVKSTAPAGYSAGITVFKVVATTAA
jgi:hypothetical protein